MIRNRKLFLKNPERLQSMQNKLNYSENLFLRVNHKVHPIIGN